MPFALTETQDHGLFIYERDNNNKQKIYLHACQLQCVFIQHFIPSTNTRLKVMAYKHTSPHLFKEGSKCTSPHKEHKT